jgi:hypothetical protein
MARRNATARPVRGARGRSVKQHLKAESDPLERNLVGSFTPEEPPSFLGASPDTTCKPAYRARIHSEEKKAYARKCSIDGPIERRDVIDHSSRRTLPLIPSVDLSPVDMQVTWFNRRSKLDEVIRQYDDALLSVVRDRRRCSSALELTITGRQHTGAAC